jgi:choice-of-anchor A domain-containing protein
MANTNASLTVYVGDATGSDTSLSWHGNNTVNQPGYARNLIIYGLPTCTSMDLSGNAGWTACVYAPDADMTGAGGGFSDQDTQGSIVVKSMTLKGHWSFHYDESLKGFGPSRGWVAKNWSELDPNK